ncbi:MAG: PQQ-binding-like beta-propeller repeat protein [Sandaracinaceae bacterium]|nr:PQQ-binding-like beta-propeller repeat protein [Sandaracinaceae bacterium]
MSTSMLDLKKALFFLSALLWLGCGGAALSAFGYEFPDNRLEDLAPVLEALSKAQKAGQGRSFVVAVSGEEQRMLVALDLEAKREQWRVPFEAETRPEILGDLVLCADRKELVAFELESGRRRWGIPLPDLAYVGGDRDGDLVYPVFSVGAMGGARRESVIFAIDATQGRVLWKHEIKGVIGRPVALASTLFVPYERQNLVMLNGETGKEIARIRSTDDVIGWVRAEKDGIYYGHRSIYHLDESSVFGKKARARFLDPALPPLPPLREGEIERLVDIEDDAFIPRPGARSARGRIRAYLRPRLKPDGAIGLAGDTSYLVYYRYVFAFDPQGTLRWAKALDEDVIAASPQEEGLFVLGERGSAKLLDAQSGGERWQTHFPLSLASASITLNQLTPIAPPSPSEIRQSLISMILDPDNRLLGGRALAIRLLGELPDPQITRDLLDLYEQGSMPRPLKDTLALVLKGRKLGKEHLLRALERRYDYLEQSAAPPFEVIVPSLVSSGAKEVLPLLMQHLFDHETPAPSLVLIAQAIGELGDASVVPALRRFLTMYKADSALAEVPEVLALVAKAIFIKGSPEDREFLASISSDPYTREGLGVAINQLFEEERKRAEEEARKEAEAARRAAEEAARRARAALPEQLSQDQIDQTFAGHIDAIRACLVPELERNPELGQLRIVFILSNDGRASDIGITPSSPELNECLKPVIVAMRFPEMRSRRQRAQFTLSLREGWASGSREVRNILEERIPPDAPWWTWWVRRAEAGRVTTLAQASQPVRIAWWEKRPAPESKPRAPVPEVPVGAPTSSPPSDSQGGPPQWWSALGASEEEAPEKAEAPPPPPPPQPRGRRGKSKAAQAQAQPSPQAPPEPPPPPPPPSSPPPQAPENEWWKGAGE